MLLYQALKLDGKVPTYYHLPLVVGADGRRLAKRHGDTRLSFYREQGVPASRILALLAKWVGVECDPHVITPESLLASFRLDQIPKSPIVFSEADDRYLRFTTT